MKVPYYFIGVFLFLFGSSKAFSITHLHQGTPRKLVFAPLYASSSYLSEVSHQSATDVDISSTLSTSRVSYKQVLEQVINPLFPPTEVEQRNAASRTDGYWPYIRQGEEPPRDFTYGEFDFYFFAQLLDQALDFRLNRWGCETNTFLDVGSGTGRLVWGAAALHPALQCRGIELLSSIHEKALKIQQSVDDSLSNRLHFQCASMTDPTTCLDADIIFCFSSCFSSDLLSGLSKQIGQTCKPGTIVITTEFMLPLEGPNYRFSLIQKVDGHCWLTGGTSTAYIHEVQQSCLNG